MRISLVVSCVLVAGGLSSAWSQAQSKKETRSGFEAASIKLNKSGELRSSATPSPNGTYQAENQAVAQLIRQAFTLKPFQIVNAPKWIDDRGGERYDILAKAEGPASRDELMLMLQQLLEDRFKLAYHRTTAEAAVYTLVIAKSGTIGPNLRKPRSNEGALYPVRGAPGRIDGTNATLRDLAFYLSGALITGSDRLVIDKTGLADRYDFTLEWSPDPSGRPPELAGLNLPAPQSGGPSLFEALQQQLGLKLEATRAPVEMFVIDRVERPTEN